MYSDGDDIAVGDAVADGYSDTGDGVAGGDDVGAVADDDIVD